ncbi:LuxR C-terminal-related transcriptional regulator [Actinokineospora sp. 24-640]
MDGVRVGVHATDPVSLAGLAGTLGGRAGLVLAARPPQDCDIVVLAVDRPTPAALAVLRRWRAESDALVVLVADEPNEADPRTLLECRVRGVLARRDATADRLAGCVRAVAGGGAVMPADLLGELLRHAERLPPAGSPGLSPREADVLRLIAEGWDTDTVAGRLDCSERAVQNTVYALTTRLGLRNRVHAVAYALREGLL